MGRLSDTINQMIQKILESAEWTSASPGHINTLIQVNAIESPDLEKDIRELTGSGKKGKAGIVDDDESNQVIKNVKSDIKKTKDQLKGVMSGNIGDINNFTSEQFGNITKMARDPTGFISGVFIKKFAKGVGVLILAQIIFEAVKVVIGELLKPGRALDRRFKRIIERERLQFRLREDQQKLKQGFSNIIITTGPRLRGGQGQFVNTLDIVAGRRRWPENVVPSSISFEAAGISFTHAKGLRAKGFR